MTLDSKIHELAHTLGADFYGVADLEPAREAILEQGGPVTAAFPRAISVGIILPHAIVDQLPERDTAPLAAKMYRHHGYDVVNQRLDHMTSRLSNALQQEGHRVLPVAASGVSDGEKLRGIFSNKMAAHLAGLGWIGKSCLLVTPEAGPRVRWGTVLTDAPLEATGELTKQRCGNCQECVDICPPHAFTGRPFRPEDPREARFAAHKCQEYQAEQEKTTGTRVCGLCLYVCPHGRKASTRTGQG